MKLIKTLRIVATLAMARTFGRYVNSGWNGEFEYARYEWRGREWCIPLTHYDIDEAEAEIASMHEESEDIQREAVNG